ncbi:MAG: CHAT domain-containing tetratricopeptide repeat protein [Chitinophagales bacterium]
MDNKENIHIIGDGYWEAVKNIHNQGNECFDEGNYDIALACFEQALDLRIRGLGKTHLDVADSYNNIGNTYYYKGLYNKALRYHLESKNIKTNLLGEDNIALAVTYNGIGICYDAQGFYNKALAYYNKSLDLRIRYLGSEHSSVAQSLNNLGLCYHSKGTYDTALVYLQKALKIRQQHFGEDHWSVAQTLLNMGACYFSKDKHDEALHFYNKSLKIKQAIYGDHHPNIASVLDNIGFCYRQKGMFDVALNHHNMVLTIRQKTLASDHPSLAITYNNIANCLQEKGFFVEALSYCQNALQIVIPQFSPENILENPSIHQYMDAHILLEILQSKAICFQSMHLSKTENKNTDYGRLALKTYQLAAKLMTQLRRGYKAESTHLTLAEKAHQMYEAAIETAIKNDATNLAFTFAEQGKGMVLLGSLKDIDARLASDIPEKWLNEAYDLRISLTELDNAINRERCKVEIERNLEQLRQWQNQHFDYQRDYESLIEKLEKEYPNYFQLKYKVHNIVVQELQKSLDNQTAIVEFFVGRHQTYLFVIGRAFVLTKCIVISESTLNEQIADFIEAIYAENAKEYQQLAYALYETLLKQSLQNELFDTIQYLHIIPDGDLGFLPFETLLTQKPSSLRYAEMPYLVNNYAISYHYSATLWHYGKNKQKSELSSSFSFVGFAPVYQDIGLNYKTLYHSAAEIEGIKTAFEEKGYEAAIFLHSAASKEHFKQHVIDYKYVHIAAHAFGQPYFEQEEAYSSDGIVFSFQKDDLEGILTMAEIYNLSLNADLVVVSCCDSGVGKVAKGEGVMAINRGFLYAGARNVIYTLFKVYDRHSAELMQYLYQDILAQKAYGSSLQASKIKMITQGYAPKYWSGFVHIGSQ